MQKSRLILLTILLSLTAFAARAGDALALLQQQVESTERAFAQTMADRDFDAFTVFLDPETVFFTGDMPLRGADAVGAAWKAYFDAPQAPFSWAPEVVQVLDSGRLAFSSGPVYDALGKRVATFHSVWRRNGDGEWKIVFDKGSRACK